MTAASELLSYRPLRAPSEDGQRLQEPPLEAAPELWADNQQLLALSDLELAGQPLPEVRRAAQEELVGRAIAYTRSYREIDPPAARQGLVLAGHQPELFHPGVWYKNFALDRLVRELDVPGVNLIVDNDVCGAAGIRVPTGSLDHPTLTSVSYDRPADPVPYERRRLMDPELYARFPQHVQQTLLPLDEPPLVQSLWACDRRAARGLPDPGLLGARLAAARHALEGDWGLQTLELPLSQACSTVSFATFAAVLIGDAARFRARHNQGLEEYRAVHGLRSRTHPVPALHRDGDWVETPFWIWRDDAPQRRAVYARIEAGRITLSDRRELEISAPRAGLAERLAALGEEGVALRPKALITTMYARLVLGSLFLHGIGGAKYDQLTDWLMRDYFDLEPPAYLVLTATLRLPLSRPGVREVDVRRIRNCQRELRWHPELYVDPLASGQVHELVAEKATLLSEIPPRGQRKAWHDALTRVNERLRPLVADRRRQLEQERRRLAEELRTAQLLGSREFSLALFPESKLQALR